VWSGHRRPLPLILKVVSLLPFACHPEEAESRAKRATSDEESALSLPKGLM
jgi:hypothetical protein